MKVGLLTISTSRVVNPESDVSGQTLLKLFTESTKLKDVIIVEQSIIEDDFERIGGCIDALSDICDLVVTTGGTGLTPLDVTPEATRQVLDRECPGIVVALLQRCVAATPLGALSRLAAGVLGECLVVNFPGSPKACRECFEVLEPIAQHAIDLITGKNHAANVTHSALQNGSASNSNSSEIHASNGH